MKGGKKPSGRISAEKAEKMSLAGENGRQQISHDIQRIQVIKGDQHVTKSSKMLQGTASLVRQIQTRNSTSCKHRDEWCL
ncbi:uncharacterized protein LJ264_012199 isoform 3-T4 [Porphyrio hochstetteri]